MSILQEIVARRRRRLAVLQERTSLDKMRERALHVPVHADFARALRGHDSPSPAIIAELKRASPSAGLIRPDFDPVQLAGGLVAAGAAALSVVTEPDFFSGEDRFLDMARSAVGNRPLLRKDFLLEPWQVWESRLLGADAVLLMAEVLTDEERLAAMIRATREAGLAALVEVSDQRGLDRAVAAGAEIIGVNARDLRDFSVDLARSCGLAGQVPAELTKVAESGVHGIADLRRVRAAGFDAALVGSALMKAPDPEHVLRQWMKDLAGAGQ